MSLNLNESLPSDRQVQVDLGSRSYCVHIGPGIIVRADIMRFIDGDQVLIVTNETVAPLYLEMVREQITDKKVHDIILPDGEQFKNLEVLDEIFSKLLAEKHDRSTTLIAVGGGVIGDMTGFAAATYLRGVSFIQVPTTLLAQVDSSVGGKTAVNHPLGKNMIGAFHQPRTVIVDTNTLQSLPDREFSAGIAEILKYGLIADVDFFNWLEREIDSLMSRDVGKLTYAIEQSCRIKAKVVGSDETEQGVRAILNLGHTFGHAIETFQNYRHWIHGEAVSVGILMAMQMSYLRGNLEISHVHRVSELLQHCSLPVKPPHNMTIVDFNKLMLRDKKVRNEKLRLVLLEKIGKAKVIETFERELLQRVLSEFCGPDPSSA